MGGDRAHSACEFISFGIFRFGCRRPYGGAGGGSVPAESIVYLGDTARLPYGSKNPETIRRFADLGRERFLLGRGVKAIVVACNTATAHALPRNCGSITGCRYWA